MLIIPAIDIYKGNCVRLIKGDYSTSHKVATNVVETATSFYKSGAKWLHVVDLDGAKNGKIENSDMIIDILKNTELKLEVGGGIRDIETIKYYISKGVSRVILGSAAIKAQELVRKAVSLYGDKIAVGIDAKNGLVSAEGWTENSKINYIDMAKMMESIGVRTIIFTDISRDGTLSGPNLEQLSKLKSSVSCSIIASGGISNIEDIKNLKDMGLYAIICGKALYSGTLDLGIAIKKYGDNTYE